MKHAKALIECNCKCHVLTRGEESDHNAGCREVGKHWEVDVSKRLGVLCVYPEGM